MKEMVKKLSSGVEIVDADLDERLPEPESDVARVAWSAIRNYVRANYGLTDDVLNLLSRESLESGLFNEFISYIDSVRAYADIVESATSWLVADILVALFDRERAALESEFGTKVSESDVLESILNYIGPIYGITSVETAYQYYHLARRFPPEKRIPSKSFRFYLDAYRLERSALVKSGQLTGYKQEALDVYSEDRSKDPVLDIIQDSSSKRQLTERIMREVAGEDAYLMISDGSSHRILFVIDGEEEQLDFLFADLGRGVWTISAFVRWLERTLKSERFGSFEDGAVPVTIAVGDMVLSFKLSMVRKTLRLDLVNVVVGGEAGGDG
jgi:hypothetical protein